MIELIKRSRFLRESLLFLAFLVLSVVMTWPWARHLRYAAYDRLDSYAHAYFLWWGYHQTFRDPINLFNATILYPYRDTFAFGENDFGICVLMFPFFALGFRPLTVHSLAVLIGFALSGYGVFRLARTLSSSYVTAWIAGIVFAFMPYRFGQLDHLPIIFTGWVPLLLEALILFARQQSWKRAAWLAVAFVMNALTCLTWFVLTLLPLGLSAILLLARYGLWRKRDLWIRGAIAFSMAALILLPFFLPFYRVAHTYAFFRQRNEVGPYSAHLINWLAITAPNKLWRGLSGRITTNNELSLFPGFLPPSLALVGALFAGSLPGSISPMSGIRQFVARLTVIFLNVLILLSGVITLLAIGYGGFTIRIFGYVMISASSAGRALAVLMIAATLRLLVSTPNLFRWIKSKDWLSSVCSGPMTETLGHGLTWALTGFAGSFGLNFFVHRWLYDHVIIFRSMRMAARWSVVCYVGLAVLAGLGAALLINRVLVTQSRKIKIAVTTILAAAIMFEQRAAPLTLIRGEPDPDPLSIYLKKTPMAGGIVEIPVGRGTAGNQRYMLRAADHQRPIVIATNSFVPPLETEIQDLAYARPVPYSLIDLLESIPASYLVVHQVFLTPQVRVNIEAFLGRAVATGRLRYIQRFDYKEGDGLTGYNDLYAVTKVEPAAFSNAAEPARVSYSEYVPRWQYLPSGFQETGFLAYRLYKASFGRRPSFDEFMPVARESMEHFNSLASTSQLSDFRQREFLNRWVSKPEFVSRYAGKSNQQYVDELLANLEVVPNKQERDSLIEKLDQTSETRSTILLQIINNEAFLLKEFDPAFVLMSYFAYFSRDPDPQGFAFWLDKLDDTADYAGVSRAFATSYEYYLKTR